MGTLTGIKLISKERQRQVTTEGWTPEHDDQQHAGEIAIAAACYAMHSVWQEVGIPLIWPWDDNYWKPKDPMTDLVRAGALIAAEIDRILRSEANEEHSLHCVKEK